MSSSKNENPSALRLPKGNSKTSRLNNDLEASVKTETESPRATLGAQPWAGEKKARLAAFAAIQKKAENVKIMDLRGRSSFTDYFMICSGMTDRQVSAIADSIQLEAKRYGLPILSVEGQEDCRWVLIDLGDVVAHIFIDAVRDFYDLEKLWIGSPRVTIPETYYLHSSLGFPEQQINQS